LALSGHKCFALHMSAFDPKRTSPGITLTYRCAALGRTMLSKFQGRK